MAHILIFIGVVEYWKLGLKFMELSRILLFTPYVREPTFSPNFYNFVSKWNFLFQKKGRQIDLINEMRGSTARPYHPAGLVMLTSDYSIENCTFSLGGTFRRTVTVTESDYEECGKFYIKWLMVNVFDVINRHRATSPSSSSYRSRV